MGATTGQRATASITPVKVKQYDATLHCDVISVVGHRVECRCGWKSQSMPTFAAARAALKRHRDGHDAPPSMTD